MCTQKVFQFIHGLCGDLRVTFEEGTWTTWLYDWSNQFDHAWLNGSNEYVMSDDPNFNPERCVEWKLESAEVVRPAP